MSSTGVQTCTSANPTDSWLLDCIEFADCHIDIRRSNVRFDGEDSYSPAWSVGGAGLGGAFARTFREALLSWAEGLAVCVVHDPDHFGRFAAMPERPSVPTPTHEKEKPNGPR